MALEPAIAPPRQVLRMQHAHPERTVVAPLEALLYVPLNVAVPPLDDVHVRGAILFAVDRAALARAETSEPFAPGFPPVSGRVASHLLPDTLEAGVLSGYDPYGVSTPAHASEIAAAEMVRSRYDADGDGVCDADACDGVTTFVFDAPSARAVAALIAEDLRPLGIHLDTRVRGYAAFVDATTRPELHIAMEIGVEWLSDYPNASTFVEPLLLQPAAYNRDLAMVGATASQLRGWGYDVRHVPSLEERIEDCRPLVADAQLRCWALLDRYAMERVVPWIPYLQLTQTAFVSARLRDVALVAGATGSLAIDRLRIVTA